VKKINMFALVSMLLIAVILTGCGSNSENNEANTQENVENTTVEEDTNTNVEENAPADEVMEDVTLTYFTFSAAPDHLEDLDEMISIFEAQHPNIHIEVQTATWDDYFTSLQTRIAGNDAPDVFELNFESFVSYAAKGALLNLDSNLQSDTNYDASIYYQRSLDAFQYDNKQYGLPATFSTVVLYYNKDVFDTADVDYPAADWTWDDAIEAGKSIMDANDDTWGVYSSIHFWEFYKKAAQNNCDFFNADQTEVLINSSECVEALTTMISLLDEGVMPTSEEIGGISDGDLFANGDVGMLVSGIWMYGAFEGSDFDWDIQVEPGMATQATHFFANSVNVSATTEHPEAAYEWVKFFTSDPAMAEIRISSGWELPTLNNPDYVSGYLEQSPPESRQVVFDSLEFAIVPPVIEQQNEMVDIIGAALDQAVLGILTPQEALDQAKEGVESLINN
jgi:multiple sugar transport system substrate-binding protein